MGRDDNSFGIPDLEDTRIVREMAAGQSSALGTFYDKWSGRVYSVAISILGEQADADDIVEETFFQAWNQAGRFDARQGRASSWILNIARSRSLDRLKAIKRRREESAESVELTASSNAPDPAQELIDMERRDAVTVALLTLPPSQREVVEMAYFGGLSQAEIAQCTGQALGTVKTRIRLAMQKLREQLAPVHGISA